MNTNDSAVRILCFGDSNTWGYTPKTKERYSKNIRWSSLLQKKLGDNYEIIEEGLNSRTTRLDDPKNEGKNGKAYLLPCLESQNPVDIIILFLGTNDLKERFNCTSNQIAEGIEELLEIIKTKAIDKDNNMSKIILVCPTIVDESVEGTEEKYLGAEEKSRKLPGLYEQIAKKWNISFLNLQEHLTPSKKDGYHLDPESHQKISELFFEIISSL